MGMSPFKNCSTNYAPKGSDTPAPNPDPARWTLLDKKEFANGYVLRIKYHDCTNFEGIKVIVYRGRYSPLKNRDPHFQNCECGPFARFRPDADGWMMACMLAESF